VTVAAKRRSARVTGIPVTQGGTVSVHAVTKSNDAGKTATVRFRAAKRAKSRFLALRRG
jgi:hypothetical protein